MLARRSLVGDRRRRRQAVSARESTSCVAGGARERAGQLACRQGRRSGGAPGLDLGRGWTVFHLPSTLGSPTAVRSRTYGPDFEGLHFDLVVLLPGSLDRTDRVNHGACMAQRRSKRQRRSCWMSLLRHSLCRILGSGGVRGSRSESGGRCDEPPN